MAHYIAAMDGHAVRTGLDVILRVTNVIKSTTAKMGKMNISALMSTGKDHVRHFSNTLLCVNSQSNVIT